MRLWSLKAMCAAAAIVGMSLPAAADVELTMYYPIAVGGPLTEVVDKMIDGFEQENPDIKVKAIYAGNYDDTRVRAISAIQSGDPAQLSVLFSIDVYELLEQDLIIPFDDVVESEADREWLKSFYPALMANGTVDGKVWGVPFQRSTIVLYYNKDMFAEAGLDPESPPSTWQEMVEAAKALRTDDRWGLMIPSTGYPYWMFQALAIQNGVELMGENGTQTNFDDPKVVEALEFWRSLAVEHKVMPEGTIEWGTLRQAFVQGETAMMWHTTGNLTAVRKEAGFKFGVAMLPASVRPGSPTGGGNFYLFKGASEEEQKASLALVKYMTAPERAAEWSIATGYVGISPASYETEALKGYAEEFPPAVVARDQLEVAVAELSTYETGRVREAPRNLQPSLSLAGGICLSCTKKLRSGVVERRLRPLAEMPLADRRQVRFVLCDIDDTLTFEGRLPACAYVALERLQRGGLIVIPVTGRPAGWCDHIARMWPVDAVVGENGAFYFRHDDADRKMVRVYWNDARRGEERRRLDEIALRICREVPGAAIAADQGFRHTDLAVDYREDVAPLGPAQVAQIVAIFEAAGATAKVSSIHVNGWFGDHDKRKMVERLLRNVFAHDLRTDPEPVVFVGDSPNDAPLFAGLPNSVGVANVLAFAADLDPPPAWVTSRPGGLGFAELAEALLSAR